MNLIPIRRTALAAALLFSATAACAQAPHPAGAPIPNTAAGALATRLVDAVNSPDTAALTRYADAVLAPDAWLRGDLLTTLRGLRDDGGGVTVGDTRTLPSGGLVVQLWARRVDAGVELLIAADTAHPGQMQRFNLRASLRPGGTLRPLPRERMDDARLASTLDTELRRLAAADRFSGVVLVARGDRIVYQGAFGRRNLSAPTPISPTTRFHMASMGKMFTSVAIAQLIEQGRLSLDDSLGALLPEHAWTPQARGITVRQLLSHRAGMGGLFDREGYDTGRIYPTSTELLPLFADKPLAFAPGARYAYSNEGFETLGAIIEKLTGQRRNEYVEAHIFRQAGMSGVRVDALADTVADRAIPQVFGDDDVLGLRPRLAHPMGLGGGGAGGGHATAEDFFRFGRALLAGRLVSRAMVDTFTTPTAGGSYAYGFQSRIVNGRTLFGHSGGGPRGVAICNDTDFFADGGWSVVVMSNYDAPFCGELKEAITEMLTYQ